MGQEIRVASFPMHPTSSSIMGPVATPNPAAVASKITVGESNMHKIRKIIMLAAVLDLARATDLAS